MAANLPDQTPKGKFRDLLLDKPDSIEGRLGRIEGKPPRPAPLPPPDIERELAGLRAYRARTQTRNQKPETRNHFQGASP